jgi:hypothetical protein
LSKTIPGSEILWVDIEGTIVCVDSVWNTLHFQVLVTDQSASSQEISV